MTRPIVREIAPAEADWWWRDRPARRSPQRQRINWLAVLFLLTAAAFAEFAVAAWILDGIGNGVVR